MISGIQHFVFCRRQWALIHIEQQWEENYFTVDGELKHERTDNPEIHEKRKNTITVRAMPVKSQTLGITGKCDVVEFTKTEKECGIYIPQYEGNYTVAPIEYKRGKPKEDASDILQLLAEVYCLEEMLATQIDKGYLFYFETRRREEIHFSKELRQQMIEIFEEMHSYMDRGYTPKVRTSKKCKTCSLKDICLPELNKNKKVRQYIQGRVSE
ncbi:MAG: CRISPR-associated protein Cas4 [Lachnospiraceae bacterium]|jgi:CRISPR-associated exonuclease Cas4|nr:CRISPR-associated protein Cas4 [Lachnospiraceae bacterium]